ncbi:hypothetical protein HYX13_02320 [Candidatus Woesearchaeota archaeon]|nr:hypothetical protein [Candidatus Woesearchaeota archaeon]
MKKLFNKKGVMLEFLVGVILAILIFTPTCMFTAAIFRLSQQGEDNFGSFVTELQELSTVNGGEDAKQISVLILDEQTALVYFEPEKETLLQAISHTGEYSEIYFARPSTCLDNSVCLCLIQKYTTEPYEVESSKAENIVRVHAENPSCSLLPLKLVLNVLDDITLSCSLGVPGSSDGKYSCSQGFVIERGLVEEIGTKEGWSASDYGYRDNGRRISLNLIKTSQDILITPELPTLPSEKRG